MNECLSHTFIPLCVCVNQCTFEWDFTFWESLRNHFSTELQLGESFFNSFHLINDIILNEKFNQMRWNFIVRCCLFKEWSSKLRLADLSGLLWCLFSIGIILLVLSIGKIFYCSSVTNWIDPCLYFVPPNREGRG